MLREVYRCTYCGRFYTLRSEQKDNRHSICQMIEDKEAAGQ